MCALFRRQAVDKLSPQSLALQEWQLPPRLQHLVTYALARPDVSAKRRAAVFCDSKLKRAQGNLQIHLPKPNYAEYAKCVCKEQMHSQIAFRSELASGTAANLAAQSTFDVESLATPCTGCPVDS